MGGQGEGCPERSQRTERSATGGDVQKAGPPPDCTPRRVPSSQRNQSRRLPAQTPSAFRGCSNEARERNPLTQQILSESRAVRAVAILKRHRSTPFAGRRSGLSTAHPLRLDSLLHTSGDDSRRRPPRGTHLNTRGRPRWLRDRAVQRSPERMCSGG